MSIKDKVVVVTGGSKGLGKALAKAFAGYGATVIVSARRKEELEQAAKDIGATPITADISQESDVLSLTQTAISLFGKIDVWVNNAGIWMPHAPVEKMDWEKVHELIEVNLFGTVYGSKYALSQMRQQASGTIVNILSTSALEGRAGSSGYCASKYAAAGFTKSLRKETEGSNIKVLSVYPGGMQTNFFDEKRPAEIEKYMTPDHVAERIIENISSENPEEELIIRRPTV